MNELTIEAANQLGGLTLDNTSTLMNESTWNLFPSSEHPTKTWNEYPLTWMDPFDLDLDVQDLFFEAKIPLNEPIVFTANQSTWMNSFQIDSSDP